MAATDKSISLSWRITSIPLSHILTRHFCIPKQLPHYDFCRAFFQDKTVEALQKSRYMNWFPRSPNDYFFNIPNNLKKSPVWWELPWGGFNKLGSIDMNKEHPSAEFRKVRTKAANSYIELLKSISKDGFSFTKGPITPVHLLWDNNRFAAIQHGSHHRLVTLQYLIDNQMYSLLKDVDFSSDKGALVPCEIRLIINREDLENLVAVGNSSGQFSLSDSYGWFDLAINLIHKNNPSTTMLNESNSLLDSIYEMLHLSTP